MSREIPSTGVSVFRGAVPLTLAFLMTLSPACGGDDDGDDDGSGDIDSGTGGADAAPGADASTSRVTEFVPNSAGNIDLIEGNGGPFGVAAALRDGSALPEATLLASEGACEIWTHQVAPGLCDPPCQSGICVADDRCEPFPNSVDAGDIVVTGLSQQLRFEWGKFGYLPADDISTEDLFDEGAAITATAEGASDFSLAADGVAPLVADLDLEFDVTLIIEDGVDEVVRWTPEASGRVQLALQVGHHGAPYEGLLVCEADDEDGEIVVPGSLIARFPLQSNGLEQHSSWIARFTRDVLETEAGPIELFVGNRILIPQLDHR